MAYIFMCTHLAEVLLNIWMKKRNLVVVLVAKGRLAPILGIFITH